MADRSLTLVMGMPASGKSTHARRLGDETGAEVLSLDWIREDRMINRGAFMRGVAHRAGVILGNQASVIIDACAFEGAVRRGWLELARGYQAGAHVVFIHCSLGEAIRRNGLRDHAVPYPVMIKYARAVDHVAHSVAHEQWSRVLHVYN